jgi:putative 4-mercaptohistidine N1-methyltranferase
MDSTSFYDTDRAVSEYLLFHYGEDREVLPWGFGPVGALNYPARCVSELLDLGRLAAGARALDLGCAVGRSSFELARHCAEVVGIDYSHPFVDAAIQLRRDGCMNYSFAEEGDIRTSAVARVPSGIDRERVLFEQGDAQHLREDLGTFDVVLMANLLDRLPRPTELLRGLAGRVRSGGQLLVTTPCTWLEEYTGREEWLGGYERDGVQVRTRFTLGQVLGGDFECIAEVDLPFLIREHSRKFQWSVAMGTVWIRR